MKTVLATPCLWWIRTTGRPSNRYSLKMESLFNRHAPSLYRLRLKTGELSNNFGEELGFTGVSREVDGGAAVLLEMPLNAGKKLSHLVLETLSNEVVIGIMGITLQRWDRILNKRLWNISRDLPFACFTSSPLSGSLVHKLRRFRSGERFEIVLQGTAKGTLYLMLRVII